MARQDEIQEVIAQGRMDLDEYDEVLRTLADQPDVEDRALEDQSHGDVQSQVSEAWVLRSPIRQVKNSRVIERELSKETLMFEFRSKLVRFI